MDKKQLQLSNGVFIGANSPTALNVLIGANSKHQYENEFRKIDELNNSTLPITIITDLSIQRIKGKEIWKKIIKDNRFVAGTVPVYQVVNENKTISKTRLLDTINEQAEEGVKLITIHPTVSRELLEMSKARLVPITSRGGAVVAYDMLIRDCVDNIYIDILDELSKIARNNDVTISIGSSFRSGNLQDAMDKTYLFELNQQLKLATFFDQQGIKTIIETPGHAAPQQIFSICDKLNNICPYPIMPLGPIPMDSALEQDDLAAAIGAVLMGTRGCADILSVVTMNEHLGGIPDTSSLISALKKYSIAKHIIDIYKINDTMIDYEISLKRSLCNSCTLDMKCSRCDNLCPLYLSEMLKQKQ